MPANHGWIRTPEWRAKKAEQVRQYYIDHPEARKNLSEKTRIQFATNGNPMIGRKLSEETKLLQSKKRKQYYAEHPEARVAATNVQYAMKGRRHHSEETRRRMSEARKRNWQDPEYRAIKCQQSADYMATHDMRTTFKSGYRQDLGHFVRSAMEANYARILKYNGEQYEYEPKQFRISDGRVYTPDFYLPSIKLYVETKGWLRQDEKDKYEAFRCEYPEIRWRLLQYKGEQWKMLTDIHKPLIPAWE